MRPVDARNLRNSCYILPPVYTKRLPVDPRPLAIAVIHTSSIIASHNSHNHFNKVISTQQEGRLAPTKMALARMRSAGYAHGITFPKERILAWFPPRDYISLAVTTRRPDKPAGISDVCSPLHGLRRHSGCVHLNRQQYSHPGARLIINCTCQCAHYMEVLCF